MNSARHGNGNPYGISGLNTIRLLRSPSLWTVCTDRTPIEAELSAISEVTNQYGPMIDFGKVDDPEKKLKITNKLKAAGFDKVMHEIGNQLTYKEQMVNGRLQVTDGTITGIMKNGCMESMHPFLKAH